MRRLGMAYAGEIRSAGSVEDQAGIQADAPFAVFVALSDG
jgi:hypothetical protein